MTKKSLYRQHCLNQADLPFFSQAWWLDAVAGGENWDVCLVEKHGEILASMPFVTEGKLGFRLITSPLLTHSLGPWLKSNPNRNSTTLAHEKDLMQELIEQLPRYDSFQQFWSTSQTNWLPFFWKGFSATPYITYQIPNLKTNPVDLSRFQANARQDIKKAVNRYGLRVRQDASIDDFIELNKKTFHRQGLKVPYTDAFVRNLDDACRVHEARKIFIAEDADGIQHAGVYVVWNSHCAYLLMSGGDPALRGSGATSLCIYEALQFSATVSDTFDFEGSMVESIERFFRSFGAEQAIYLSVSHTPSKRLMAYQLMRKLLT